MLPVFDGSHSMWKNFADILIDGIRKVANVAFGVLDSTFAERYENDIKRAEKDHEFTLQLIRNQSSVFDATGNLVKRSFKKVEQQVDRLSTLCNEIVL